MKILNHRSFHFYKESIPLIIIFSIVCLFFWRVFLEGKVLMPADMITGVYFPWLDYKWGYAVGVPVKNPITSDVVSFTFPMQTYAIELMKAGKVPLWNPYILTGIPLLANFQSAPFAITNIGYVFFDTITGWNIKIILNHTLAAFGMYILLRYWRLSVLPSSIAGILYAFSGFNLIWSQWNAHTLVAAFIPFLVLAVQKFLFEQRALLWGISISIFLALQIAAGYPQVVIYTLGVLGLVTLFWIYSKKSLSLYIIKKLVLLVVFLILGIGTAAIQVLPAYELLSFSQREIEPLAAKYAFLPIDKIITFIAPDFFGNHSTYNFWHYQDYTSNTGYVGVVGFTLALIAIRYSKNRNKALALTIAVSALLLSFQSPLSHLLWSKGFLGFQAASAHRALVLWCFAISVLAAFGMEVLLHRKKTLRYLLYIIPGLLVMGIYSYMTFVLDTYLPHQNVALRNLVLPLLVAIGLFVSFLFVKVSRKLTFLFISILLIFEIFRFGWKFTPISEQRLVYPTTPVIEYLKNQEMPFRVTADEVIPINFLMQYRIPTVEGYDAVYPHPISLFLSVLNSDDAINAVGMGRYGQVDNQNGRLLDLVNTKFHLAKKTDEYGEPSHSGTVIDDYQDPKFQTVFEDKTVAILESMDALPRAFVYYNWVTKESELSLLEKLTDQTFDFTNTLLFTESVDLAMPADKGNFNLNYLKQDPQHQVIEVNTTESGFLFVSDAWYPGWSATVNGYEKKIERAHYAFRAVPVTKGQNSIEFRYDPDSYRYGIYISLASVIGLFVLLVIHLRSFVFRKKIDCMAKKTITKSTKDAAKLHEHVPPDWYHDSIKKNLGQRFWHTTRFREVSKLIEPVKGKVLDIGSADGVFTNVILEKTQAKAVVGIDVLASSVKWAKKHWNKEPRLSFEVGNAHKLSFRGGTFDAVFALEVMEHVSDPDVVLKEIHRVLKKNGYAILLVPTDNAFFKLVWFIWTKFMRGRIWDDCHVQSFDANNTLADHGKKAGFKVETDHYFLLGMLNAVKLRKK